MESPPDKLQPSNSLEGPVIRDQSHLNRQGVSSDQQIHGSEGSTIGLQRSTQTAIALHWFTIKRFNRQHLQQIKHQLMPRGAESPPVQSEADFGGNNRRDAAARLLKPTIEPGERRSNNALTALVSSLISTYPSSTEITRRWGRRSTRLK